MQGERDVEIHVSSPAPDDDCETTRPLLTTAYEAYSVSAAILPYARSPILFTACLMQFFFLQLTTVLLRPMMLLLLHSPRVLSKFYEFLLPGLFVVTMHTGASLI